MVSCHKHPSLCYWKRKKDQCFIRVHKLTTHKMPKVISLKITQGKHFIYYLECLVEPKPRPDLLVCARSIILRDKGPTFALVVKD